MMIDKGDAVAGVVAALGTVFGQANLSEIPGITEVANLSAISAIIYIVLWTIPKLTQNFRDEMRDERTFHREELEKLRTAFKCEKQ